MKLIFVLLVSGFWFLVSAPSAPALAQTDIWSNIQYRLQGGGDQVICVVHVADNNPGDVATLQGLGCLFYNILVVAIRLLGIAMFIMILIGGFKYLVAGGEPKAIESAKGTITSAIVGLVLAILSWFILALISQVTQLPLTDFKLEVPSPQTQPQIPRIEPANPQL
jgi:hypothetical protein